jgi:hypothetical protein
VPVGSRILNGLIECGLIDLGRFLYRGDPPLKRFQCLRVQLRVQTSKILRRQNA